MSELIYRTEELTKEQISDLYVASDYEQSIIEKLKSPTPVLLKGSRGVGKSFLFKICEIQMQEEFDSKRVLPVTITFRKASLLRSGNEYQFQYWMLGRICSELLRALKKIGLISSASSSFSGFCVKADDDNTRIDQIIQHFEDSWKNPGVMVDADAIPSLDDFLDTVEDICEELRIDRIVLFIDEAAHVFYPQQQREFFTLFRDLRSPYVKCNAAVYPGVTVYGDTFEPVHDAIEISINRSINDDHYVGKMKEMVLRQVKEGRLATILSKNSENFTLLAYAASGNPRYLLKSIDLAEKMDSASVNRVFREYYRGDLWAEHTKLSERYPGYQKIIDWGRDFIENIVLPELKKKNDSFIDEGVGKGTTLYFWIHKNAPHEVKEALRILEYSGIVYEEASGMRATRSEIGTRYMVNIGSLLSLEATPTSVGIKIVNNSDLRRMTEYGANYPAYKNIQGCVVADQTIELQTQLNKDIELLDLSEYQKTKLHELGLNTIGDLVNSSEESLKRVKYIADVRARMIKNSAIAAVCEYLLG